jgi:ubiquinone/menaquinone biosynthesis C-methylase UbiE
LRKFIHNPKKILSPYVKEGMRALDIGSGMGFFSLPMAAMVGEKGCVICVDLQDKMLLGLARRAQKAGLAHRIECRRAQDNSIMVPDLDGTVDFALAFAMVHEVPDKDRLFREMAAAVKQGGKLLIVEPRGHVSADAFESTLGIAAQYGFSVVERPRIAFSRSAALEKTGKKSEEQ